MQIIILSLLENFEFSLPPQTEKTKIYRKPCQIMLPMAKGEKGVWMGLHIKPTNYEPLAQALACLSFRPSSASPLQRRFQKIKR
jgi:hypothetical protein